MEDNFIKCRDGKEREIFPALIKDKNRIRHYAANFNSDMAIMNILSPDLDKVSKAEKEGRELSYEESFSEAPYESMMALLTMAFGDKYSPEEIEEFVDVRMVREIFDIFFDISGYKKKVMNQDKA